MSKDSGEERPRDAPSADSGEPASTTADPSDPLLTAASRGEDPLGMFASDDDQPVEPAASDGAQEVLEAAIEPTATNPAEAGSHVPTVPNPAEAGSRVNVEARLEDEPSRMASAERRPAIDQDKDDAPPPVIATPPPFSVERRMSPVEDEQSRRPGLEPRDLDDWPAAAVPLEAPAPPLGAAESVPGETRPGGRLTSSEPRVGLEQAEWSELRPRSEPSSAPPLPPAQGERRDAEGGVSPPPSATRPQAVEPGAPAPFADEWRPLVRAAARATGPDLRRPAVAPPSPDDRRSFPPAASKLRRRLTSTPVLVVAAILVVSAVAFGAWRLVRGFSNQPAPVAAVQEGRLTIESLPTGVQVEIDGAIRGTTPLGLKVKAGRHLVRVGGPGGREIDVVVAAGGDVSHHIDLPEARTRLHVATVPSGATIKVDGQTRGAAPLDLEGLTPGIHTITVEAGGTTVRRDVDVRSGADNSVVISLGSGGPTTGWVTVASPFDVEVYEGSRLIGRSRDGQMLLVSGAHDLTLTNADLGYKESSRVNVAAGATATVRVQPRNGQLSVNAIPWAEVFLDGVRIGETPIANYAVPIGQHEVRLVHPQLGEQRRTVVVTLTSPTRIGVPFSK